MKHNVNVIAKITTVSLHSGTSAGGTVCPQVFHWSPILDIAENQLLNSAQEKPGFCKFWLKIVYRL